MVGRGTKAADSDFRLSVFCGPEYLIERIQAQFDNSETIFCIAKFLIYINY